VREPALIKCDYLPLKIPLKSFFNFFFFKKRKKNQSEDIFYKICTNNVFYPLKMITER